MKKNSKVFLLVMGMIMILAVGRIGRKTEEKKQETVPITLHGSEKKKEGGAEEKAKQMTKQRIWRMKNKPGDNVELPESEALIDFKGYGEFPDKFGWMAEEDWKLFQEKLKGYLQKKGLDDVTMVTLHPNSIQEINEYERYIYLDVDYKTADADRLIIKAICDTYMEKMRFAFEVQYGS